MRVLVVVAAWLFVGNGECRVDASGDDLAGFAPGRCPTQ